MFKATYKLFLIVTSLITIGMTASPLSNASNLSKVSLSKSKIEYQNAAQFSALKWHQPIQQPIAVSIKPLKNYSGIPTDAVEVKAEYYEHGKLPKTIHQLVKDLVLSTRLLDNSRQNPDVELQLIVNNYSHPFKYAPDNHWYRKLQDQVDRWGITKNNANVGLTLVMTSKSNRFKPWVSSVESTLSHCDLNAVSHSLMAFNHSDDSLLAYSESSMGQAFVSASNYLLLQAVSHLNDLPQKAQVVSTSHNELLLDSEQSQFVTGEQYQLTFNHSYYHPATSSGGTIQVVKSMGQQAIAYPVDLRPDHIRTGDWVELEKSTPLNHPNSTFVAKNKCATVGIAQHQSSDDVSSDETTQSTAEEIDAAG